jgi:predicted enzyme related to lactoylglutathione lyase
MPVSEGGFVWYEYMATDDAAAVEFYTGVVGWRAEDSGMPGPRYTLLKAGDRPVAGVMAFPDAKDWPMRWIAHILTQDVDAMAARVAQTGGAIHRPPTDIPGIGRFAVVADPQGATFMLFRADGTPAPDIAPTTPGAIGWHELHTTDWDAAFTFYHGLFGWEKSQALDMGPMGTYQLFKHAGADMGAMLNEPRAPAPYWLNYVSVENIDDAATRLSEAGGTLIMPPREVPGGAWVLLATDPQGSMFALLGPRQAETPS